MKKLYLFLLTVLLLVGVLTSCTILFDVRPKEIYSPIELDGSLIPIKLSESSCKIPFKGNSDSLNYGVLIFYDSLAAASFVRERKTIGQLQAVKAVRSTQANQFLSDTVRFDNTKGQFLYITPFAYRSADSLAIRTKQDYSKVFTSQGYMQLKISPWTHVTDVVNATTQDNIKLFTYQNSLAYFKYNRTQLAGYRLDNQNKKWTLLGDIKNSFCITGCNTSSAVSGYINKVSDLYEVNNKIIAVAGARENVSPDYKYNSIGPLYNSIGVLAMKQDFSIDSYSLFESISITQNFWSLDGIFSNLNTQNNLQVMYMKIDVTGNSFKTFLDYPYSPSYPSSEISLAYLALPSKFLTNAFTYDVSTNQLKPLPVKYTVSNNKTIFPYNIGVKVGSQYILNEGQEVKSFSLFSADNSQIVQTTQSIPASNQLINFFLVRPIYGMLICISSQSKGYLIASNQTIFNVSLVNDAIKITSIYEKWFPGATSKSINQGVSINNKIYVLVNGFEIWEFDPSQLAIDFTRPGAVTIVSL